MEWTQVVSVIIFIVLLVAEIVISTKKDLALYQKEDTWANVALGLITFLSKIGTKGIIYTFYLWVYQFAIMDIPDDFLWFSIAFLLNDFWFYWYHRISHETRAFWALHVAHHSSEKLNITTAMRGNFVNNLFHALLWVPLIWIGFHPLTILLSDAIAYFYQLWLHTTIIPKLGPIEWVMNTPSHHRVHHGSNPKYIDKNYAAIFIIWDRMFGTFEEEDEKVIYGLKTPFNSFNPLKIAF